MRRILGCCDRRSYATVLEGVHQPDVAVPFVAVGGNRFLQPPPAAHDDDDGAAMMAHGPGLGRAPVTLLEVGAGEGGRQLVRWLAQALRMRTYSHR